MKSVLVILFMDIRCVGFSNSSEQNWRSKSSCTFTTDAQRRAALTHFHFPDTKHRSVPILSKDPVNHWHTHRYTHTHTHRSDSRLVEHVELNGAVVGACHENATRATHRHDSAHHLPEALQGECVRSRHATQHKDLQRQLLHLRETERQRERDGEKGRTRQGETEREKQRMWT